MLKKIAPFNFRAPPPPPLKDELFAPFNFRAPRREN